jgi:competence protein ComEA
MRSQLFFLTLALLWPCAPAWGEQGMAVVELRVQVRGAVRHPGLYRVTSGSRLAELILEAGGPRPDAQLNGVNLAKRLSDGDSFYVPSRQDAKNAPPPPAAPVKRRRMRRMPVVHRPPSSPVNLNLASESQIENLPGVGPAMAQAILQLRAQRGRFQSTEDLREVAGIGKKRFERLAPYIRVE